MVYEVTCYAKKSMAAPAVIGTFDTIESARAFVADEMSKSTADIEWTRSENFGAESIECAGFGFQINPVQL